MRRIFGCELILNLYGCNKKAINSRQRLKTYSERLCRLIKMKRYGRPLIPYFGLNEPHTAGYSLVQLIETSSITGHFSPLWGAAYINIFSCSSFDHKKARQFTKKYFGAKKVVSRLLIR